MIDKKGMSDEQIQDLIDTRIGMNNILKEYKRLELSFELNNILLCAISNAFKEEEKSQGGSKQ